jgi:hypothetical protein
MPYQVEMNPTEMRGYPGAFCSDEALRSDGIDEPLAGVAIGGRLLLGQENRGAAVLPTARSVVEILVAESNRRDSTWTPPPPMSRPQFRTGSAASAAC